MLERDILECDLPPALLAVLLQDRASGRNLIWATKDYEERGAGFGETDAMQAPLIAVPGRPVVRPRVDKDAAEQRQRSTERAEVFTPAWICNRQNNLIDAAWFGWKKRDSSPFNTELKKFDPLTDLGWKSTYGQRLVKFPKKLKKTWQDYVKAPRLEVACGEAPYLTSRYDTVSGKMIPVNDRVGFLGRKLRVITENVGANDLQDWLYWAKRAVQSVYGFDWQGDNVLLARENVLATVIEAYHAVFSGEEKFDLSPFVGGPTSLARSWLLEIVEIISWNIWQMDGIKKAKYQDLLQKAIRLDDKKSNKKWRHDTIKKLIENRIDHDLFIDMMNEIDGDYEIMRGTKNE